MIRAATSDDIGALGVVRFEASHLRGMSLQPTQTDMYALMSDALLSALANTNAFTALHKGRALICAGLGDVGPRRFVWAFLSELARPAMLRATRAFDAILGAEPVDVFAHILPDVPANPRWARLLKFEPTGDAEALPDGKTYELWVRKNRHDV